MMAERLDKETLGLVKKCGAIADAEGIKAFVVGGIVRDVILNRKTIDIDITVEGSGVYFGKVLADELKGAYKSFEKFGTAKVYLKTRRIDVATARAEKYAHPAALPEVSFSDLKSDLYRRDFTINSMAVSINKESFGEFYDPFFGINDLKSGILRTLHAGSFIDDPTRIIRAVRFASRFDYRLEEKTMMVMKLALKKDIFAAAPGERLADELFILLEEKDPFLPMVKMQELGIMRKLCKGIVINKQVEALFARLKKAKAGRVAYFIAVLSTLSASKAAAFCKRLKLSNEESKTVIDAKKHEKKIIKALSGKIITNSSVYSLLKGLTKDTLDYLSCVKESKVIKNRIKLFTLKLSGIKASVTGADLIKLGIKPGPQMGKILNRVLEAKLDGKVKTKNDEIAFIKQAI